MQVRVLPGPPFPHKGVSSLEPIEGSGEAEDSHEADGGLLVAGGDDAPFLESGPEVLDRIAVVVDLIRAGDGGLVVLERVDVDVCREHALDLDHQCRHGRPGNTVGSLRHGSSLS